MIGCNSIDASKKSQRELLVESVLTLIFLCKIMLVYRYSTILSYNYKIL